MKNLFRKIEKHCWRLIVNLQRLEKKHPIVDAVLKEKLTYLRAESLIELETMVMQIEKQRLQGIIIEAGCALGGSAIVIARAKSSNRPMFIYDVFDLIPPPTLQDGKEANDRYNLIQSGKSSGINGNNYYGYEENLYEKVVDNFSRYNLTIDDHSIFLIKGLFQDTLNISNAVILAHIDGDWYESVKTCLERITPHMALGGVLVIDDYDDWSGCRKAVDEYFLDKKKSFRFVQRTRLHIVRRK
jgi:hypothetical protein